MQAKLDKRGGAVAAETATGLLFGIDCFVSRIFDGLIVPSGI